MIDHSDIESLIRKLAPQSEKLAIAIGGMVLDQWTARRAELKGQKLLHYAEKDIKTFFQIDVFNLGVNGGDDVMRPDADGHCVSWSNTEELMNGASVRLLIEPGEDSKDVTAMLEKVTRLKEDWIGYSHRAIFDSEDDIQF